MRWWIGGVVALLITAWTGTGNAFCGFYVGGEDGGELKNDATQVVLMRHGRHTVMSIQNNYEGPPEDFALVIPVPTVLGREDVRTLPREIFDRVDRLASPRLVEYWEQDPCPSDAFGGLGLRGTGRGAGGLGNLGTMGFGSAYGRGAGRPVVRVEAEFAVDEYEIVILGADESTGLERWLRAHGYRIPRGAARVLRPYVEAGTRFLVARVEADRLEFRDGRAQLSPLRVHYESDELTLPIRLGMLNADGPQDLIVHVLAPTRYEVANRPNVRVPTNLRVAESVRGQFGTFYAALFDATMRRDPDAVVTEYAWSPGNCDPCPGPTLTVNDIATLGGDATQQTRASAPSVRRLDIRGRFVSFSIPESDDEATQSFVETALRRQIATFDRCIVAMARSRRVDRTGSFRAHIGFVLMAGAQPIAELAGPVPGPIAQCIRRVGRRALSGEGLITAGPSSARAQVNASWSVSIPSGGLPPLTLTRLHTRYRADGRTDDLIFREAGGLVGGRGVPTAAGTMVDGSTGYGAMSQFQARFAILHPWAGPMSCASPHRGMWGGRPGPTPGGPSVQAAEDIGEVRQRAFALEDAVLTDVPGLDLSTPRPPRRRRPRAAGKTSAGPLGGLSTPVASGAIMACAAQPGRRGAAFALLLVGLGLLSCRRRGARRPR